MCRFMMLYESHVNDLALSKLDEESRSLSAEGMGKEMVDIYDVAV